MNPALALAKTASELVSVRKHVRELETKLAEFEKRAAAEAFLIETMANARAPYALKPSSIADFIEKRAVIEKTNLEAAKLAIQMTSMQGFEIGAPDQTQPLPSSSGSRADDEFTEYLLGSSRE